VSDGDGDFIATNGPIDVTREAGHIVLGLCLERRHCTPHEVAHSALLIALVEAAMDRTIADIHGRKAALASLTCDMLGPARLGDRIEARCETTRVALEVIFMRGEVRANGEPVLTASALWKLLGG
jgi:acyl-coenzyme A thioesterase PaaI-like protein